jgi:hypothetical protein
LPVIQPEGGTYSGIGVSGSTFNPNVAGPGTIDLSYTYTDGSGCSSTLFGTAQVENCTAIEESELSIHGTIIHSSKSFTLNIFDLQGRLIFKDHSSNSVQNLNYLVSAPGIYLVTLYNDTKFIYKTIGLSGKE